MTPDAVLASKFDGEESLSLKHLESQMYRRLSTFPSQLAP